MDRFWFNTRTGEVEEGRQSAWTDRLGPFKTRDEAARALETARKRTEAWDEEDAAWNEGSASAVARPQ